MQSRGAPARERSTPREKKTPHSSESSRAKGQKQSRCNLEARLLGRGAHLGKKKRHTRARAQERRPGSRREGETPPAQSGVTLNWCRMRMESGWRQAGLSSRPPPKKKKESGWRQAGLSSSPPPKKEGEWMEASWAQLKPPPQKEGERMEASWAQLKPPPKKEGERMEAS